MTDLQTNQNDESDFLSLAAQVVAAYVQNNSVPAVEVPGLIKSVFASLRSLPGNRVASDAAKPAVPIKKSVTDAYIVCLEDGKKLKMLKRYLRSRYKLTPDEYRMKWGLPVDYPMVAPNYAEQRSQFAKKIGLGRTRGKAKQTRRAKAA